MPVNQRLYGSNVSPDISEALEARTKDPLWFLARQWQFGEFEAEPRGAPAQITIEMVEFPITSFFPRLHGANADKHVSVDLAAPLEAVIEPEDSDEMSAWNSETLSYEGRLIAGGAEFRLNAYDGQHLDWHDFSFTKFSDFDTKGIKSSFFTAIPSALNFKGAPSPRWWEIEDSSAYFDSPVDAEPNVLSMMLPEFFYTDIKNWFVVPAPMRSGHVRKVKSVTMVDSFGIVEKIEPAISQDETDWSMFNFSGPATDDVQVDGSLFFAPNIAMTVLNNDICEEVRFSRDENANMVWAWEQTLTDEFGNIFTTSVERPEDLLDVKAPGQYYTLKSNTLRSWIPYIPTQVADNPAVNGAISLRRARTDQAATRDDPQYRSRIVGEAAYIHEEQIPPNGLRLRRINKFARGSDGKPHFWIGRDREVTARTKRPNLRFDYVRDVFAKKSET